MQEERREKTIDSVLTQMGELKGLISGLTTGITELNVRVGIQNGRVGKLENWRTGYAFVFGVIITVLMFFKEPILGVFSDRWTLEDQKAYSARVQEDLKEIKLLLAQRDQVSP